MIHDARRVDAYRRALQQVVTPDSVVVDIGTGLGIFAFLACQAGARKVYAIEPSATIVLASAMAAANGYQDRIQFMEDVSTGITLPERADVIVSDLGGSIPLFQQHLPSIADARTRFLKPQGTLIPRSDTLWAGVVQAPVPYAKIAPSTERFGLDMQAAWKMTANLNFSVSPTDVQLMSGPQRLATLDYTRIDDPNVQSQVEWDVMRPGQGHGICLWFDRILADGVSYSTAPDEPEMVYGTTFLPWLEPVELDTGDRVTLDFRADLRGADYIFCWSTRIARAGRIQHTFRQSQFLGEVRSPIELRKQASTHVPRLSAEGEYDRLVLQMMDGHNANQDIARELQRQYPARFPALEMAIGHVAELSRKYSDSKYTAIR